MSRSDESNVCCRAVLEAYRPTPAVRVNRAFAVGGADGPGAGLALLDADRSIAAYAATLDRVALEEGATVVV